MFCLVYVYTCLFRLVLGFLYFFKYVRLLDFTFMFWLASALFLSKLGFLGKDLCMHDLACTCRLYSCIHRLVLASVMFLPKNLIFVCFVTALTCVFSVASFSYVSSPITICLPFNMFVCYHMSRLGFRLRFLNVNTIHSHVHALMS